MRGWPDNFKKPLIFTVLGRGIRSRKAVSDGGVEPGIWTFVLGAAGYPLAPAVPLPPDYPEYVTACPYPATLPASRRTARDLQAKLRRAAFLRV